jgi:hypothetical protein
VVDEKYTGEIHVTIIATGFAQAGFQPRDARDAVRPGEAGRAPPPGGGGGGGGGGGLPWNQTGGRGMPAGRQGGFLGQNGRR